MENLLIRYFAGTLSGDEKSVLFEQLEQDDALKAEFVRLQNLVAVSGMEHHAEDACCTPEHFRALMRRVLAVFSFESECGMKCLHARKFVL